MTGKKKRKEMGSFVFHSLRNMNLKDHQIYINYSLLVYIMVIAITNHKPMIDTEKNNSKYKGCQNLIV